MNQSNPSNQKQSSQSSLWQDVSNSSAYAELCNALYERELNLLVQMNTDNAKAIQGRLKSLPHYIKRTAYLMIQIDTPLELDIQNATWSAKQSAKMPITGQEMVDVWQWYQNIDIQLGLVIPVALNDRIVLDSVDKVDSEKQRIRTNAYGWFNSKGFINEFNTPVRLLKPNKKVMMSACAGHCWRKSNKERPIIPSLRELLLSCSIRWQNFKQPTEI